MIDKLWGLVSHDIGIDLGTANTLVLVAGRGIVVREPSIVAMHKKTKAIIAVGSEAKKMMGKMPANLTYVRPLRDGVISDFDVSMAMLRYFIRSVHTRDSLLPKIPRPRVVIGIPSGVTPVERRAVQEAALAAGAREVYLGEGAMGAAGGGGVALDEGRGTVGVGDWGGEAGGWKESFGGKVGYNADR